VFAHERISSQPRKHAIFGPRAGRLDKASAPASRNAELEELMKIYQALPDVHFRFAGDSRSVASSGDTI
jgi:hypothetical protein